VYQQKLNAVTAAKRPLSPLDQQQENQFTVENALPNTAAREEPNNIGVQAVKLIKNRHGPDAEPTGNKNFFSLSYLIDAVAN
jgi:hypothetical protein